MPVGDWRAEYGALLDDVVGRARRTCPALDLTVECITHRFTPGSKQVLLGWYPRTQLEMDEDAAHAEARQVRRRSSTSTRRTSMRELRGWFDDALADRLPAARALYWT